MYFDVFLFSGGFRFFGGLVGRVIGNRSIFLAQLIIFNYYYYFFS